MPGAPGFAPSCPAEVAGENQGERRGKLRTEYLFNREIAHVLAALTPSNALVMRVCLHTGLRLGDVLALRTEDLCSRPEHRAATARAGRTQPGTPARAAAGANHKTTAQAPEAGQPRLQFWIREQKTGKRRRVNLTKELAAEMVRNAGEIWIFEGKNDLAKHRTRQAVWADVKRAAKAFRLPQNVAPHSVRKVYAVDLMHKYHDLKRVQRALNHSNPAVTMVYAMADKLYAAKYPAARRS